MPDNRGLGPTEREQLMSDLRVLAQAIPEEKDSEELYYARDRIWRFIDYHASERGREMTGEISLTRLTRAEMDTVLRLIAETEATIRDLDDFSRSSLADVSAARAAIMHANGLLQAVRDAGTWTVAPPEKGEENE